MPIQIDQQIKQRQATTSMGQISLKGLLSKEIHFGRAFGYKEKSRLFSDIGLLLKSGLDLQSAFEMVIEGSWKKRQQGFLKTLQEKLVLGSSLHAGFADNKDFSPFETQSLKIGEETGRLIHVFEELADFNLKMLGFKRQFLSAISYPLFLIGFSILVIYFMLKYLVPMFEGIFARFDGELPAITKSLIAVSEAVNDHFLTGLLCLAALFLAYRFFQKKDWMHRIKSFVIIKTPFIGPLLKKIYLARFCRSMYFLLESKIPLLNAIQLTKEMIRLRQIHFSLNQVADDILHGQTLHQSLKQFPFYPGQLISLIRVGEESGSLELVFMRMSNQYNEEIEVQSKAIGKMLEPALIIILGFFIGLILIAMYLPIFQMSLNA